MRRLSARFNTRLRIAAKAVLPAFVGTKIDKRRKKRDVRGQDSEGRDIGRRSELRGQRMEARDPLRLRPKPFASGGGSARQRIARKIDVGGERN